MNIPTEKSVFIVKAMDCGAEENLVRMRLDALDSVHSVSVDLPQREVTVFHAAPASVVSDALNDLGLGAKHLETVASELPDAAPSDQRRVLWAVLLINFGFFVVEMGAGLIANSMGLIADSLDMLADSFVYGLALLAVGASVLRKKQVAKWSGYLQAALAIIGLLEVLRRFLGLEAPPDYEIMIVVATLALLANVTCLYLLKRSQDGDAHIQASMIFTSNDIWINAGVVVAAVLVLWSDSNLPDLLIGLIVFSIVIRGAFRILKIAK